MRSKVTIFCHCVQNTFSVSKIGFILIYKDIEKIIIIDANSKGMEDIEIECVISALNQLKNDCYVEIFMLPGKARIKLSLDRSKLKKEVRAKLNKHNVQFYWLRKDDYNSQIDRLSKKIAESYN